MKRSLKTAFAIAVILTFSGMGQPSQAQVSGGPGKLTSRKLNAPVPAATTCCVITAINSTTGMVSATENATGKAFQFKVADSALLNSLKVGQGVYANFGASQVSVDGKAACCAIVSAAAVPATAPLAVGAIQNKVAPAVPCCPITAINSTTGMVSATENATGKAFQFKVADSALLNALKVGQGIYANFAASQVSVDGKAACCNIVIAAAAPATSTSSAATSAAPPPPPLPPAGGSSGNSIPPPPTKTNPPPANGGVAIAPGGKTPREPIIPGIALSNEAKGPMETMDLDPNLAGALQTSSFYPILDDNHARCETSLSLVKRPLAESGRPGYVEVKFDMYMPGPVVPQPFLGCSAIIFFYGSMQLKNGWTIVSFRASDDQLNPLDPDVFTLVNKPSGASLSGRATLNLLRTNRAYEQSVYLYMQISGPKGTNPYPPRASASPGSTTPPAATVTEQAVCGGPSTLEGVDVSTFNGTVNWQQVQASGRTFAYAMAANGTYHDLSFPQNYAAIKAAGMVRGAYQLFHPEEDPIAQANIALQAIGTLQPGDLPLALNVETTGGMASDQIGAEINSWMTYVKAHTGQTPILFSPTYILVQLGSALSTLANDPLWTANAGTASCPAIPSTWQNWILRLYSLTGTVPGIQNPVDLDRFNGTLADLEALTKQ